LKDAATDAIAAAKASPVNNEPGVTKAITDLKNIVDKPDATPEEIQKGIDALNKAVADATAARKDAIDKANKLINKVNQSEVSNEPVVIDAVDNLNDVIKDDTSQNQTIIDSTGTLNGVHVDATDGRNDAKDNADNMIDKATMDKVLKDQRVEDAKQNLLDVLADPGSTTKDIIDATKKLEDTIKNVLIEIAQKAIDDAKNSDVADKPEVIDAIDDLDAVIHDPDATIDDIDSGINKLKDAVDNQLHPDNADNYNLNNDNNGASNKHKSTKDKNKFSNNKVYSSGNGGNTGNSSDTSDEFNVAMWIVLAGIVLTIVIPIIVYIKRKKLHA
jgi:hypothetical protein